MENPLLQTLQNNPHTAVPVPSHWLSRRLDQDQQVQALLLDLHDGGLEGILIVAADRADIPNRAMLINAADPPQGYPDQLSFFCKLLDGVRDGTPPDYGVLMIRARAGDLATTDQDLSWARAFHVAAEGRVRDLGAYLITVAGSRPIAEAA